MSTAVHEQSCKERVGRALSSRISDIKELWQAYNSGEEDRSEEFCEYGLSFDYVAPNTFEGQRRGYFRYQISWGGPSEEFRFFCDENHNVVRIEFWFLDWFDGAKKILTGENFTLMAEIFDFFKETGTTGKVYQETMND